MPTTEQPALKRGFAPPEVKQLPLISSAPPLGRAYKYSYIDEFRRYLSDNPTASKIASLLKQVDQGDVAAMMELSEEIEGKDSHWQGVIGTRRQGLTALDWTVEPAEVAGREAQAKIAADYLRDVLDNSDSWPDALEHLATALGPNVSVVELVWTTDSRRPIEEFVCVPGHRLITDPFFSNQLLMETDDDPLGIPMPKGKFVVYHPNPRAGFPFRVTMIRAAAMLWLTKHFAVADWSAFCEVFGQPVRVGKFAPDSPTEVQAELRDMLQQMGSDSWAMVPTGTELELLEANRSGQPFGEMLSWVEDKMTILALGQTLTTDIGDKGSFAASKTHENVRADLLKADIKSEARCIRSQIFRPIIEWRFPGMNMPIPNFCRTIEDERQTEAERLDVDQIKTAIELKLPLDEEQVYDKLTVSKPTGQGKPYVYQTTSQNLDDLYPLIAQLKGAAEVSDLELVNATRAKIAGLMGVALSPLTTLPTASVVAPVGGGFPPGQSKQGLPIPANGKSGESLPVEE